MTADFVRLVRAMREEFDRSFVEPLVLSRPAEDDLLALQISGHDYAVRLSEIAGLHENRSMVSVPSPVPELLGLSAFRGVLVPVYDLALLLGFGAATRPRYLLLTREPHSVALAFDTLTAHLRVARAESAVTHREAERGHVLGATEHHGALYPILSIASLLESISSKERSYVSAKER
jgi:purine-binding chemotaxis protein CheW